MLATLPDAPANVLAFRAVGSVHADDYRTVLDPAIDRVIADGGTVNLALVFGDDFDGYSFGALWQDARLESKPATSWGRIALITDHTAVAEIIHAIAFLLPCELQIFRTSAKDKAMTWASRAPERPTRTDAAP